MLAVTTELVIPALGVLSDFEYCIVQHLKQDTAEFVGLLARSGIKINKVVGVSYSVDPQALERIRGDGINVEVVEYSEISSRLVALRQEAQRPSVILDVGGYGSAVALRRDLAEKVPFIVEDTNNGLWRYREIHPHCPIVEVASIPNKAVENGFVGRRIVDAIDTFCFQNALSMPSEDVVVVGFGGIGRAVCSSLAFRGIRANVVDVNERHLAIAEAVGHPVAKSVGDFASAKIIIGCSGVASVAYSHLAGMKPGTMLISGSSKRVEYEDVLLQGKFVPCDLQNALRDKVSGAILVNQGEPINLHYGSLDEETSDFMYANIASAMIEGASLRVPGIFSLSEGAQQQICKLWWARYRSGAR
jgi:S-adenosylhomocysteine hydrolase